MDFYEQVEFTCPHCGEKDSATILSFYHNAEWRIPNDKNRVVQYLKPCKSCGAPLYVYKSTHEVTSLLRLKTLYGANCFR